MEKWKFPINDGGTIDDHDDTRIETFAGNPATFRESILDESNKITIIPMLALRKFLVQLIFEMN
jgi:hypothetical protein